MKTPASATVAAKSIKPFSIVGIMLIVFAALITLTVLFFIEEDWRGKHAWQNCRRQAEADGVELDFAKLCPAPVPDDENFAMTPFLAPLFDLNPKPLKPGQSAWRDKEGTDRAFSFATNINSTLVTKKRPVSVITSGHPMDFDGLAGKLHVTPGSGGAAQAVLADLSQYQPVLDEIETASHRRYSRFNIFYDDPNPTEILLPHLAVIKRITILLSIQASADLSLGRTDTAMKKVRLMLYLTDSIESEPFLITHLVRFAMLDLSREVIWQGLAERQWSDAQLQELEESLRKLNLPKDALNSMNAERAAHASRLFDCIQKNPRMLDDIFGSRGVMGSTYAFLPSGWLYQERVNFVREFGQKVLPGVDVATGRFFPQQIAKDFDELQKNGNGAKNRKESLTGHVLHHDVVATMLTSGFGNYYRRVAVAQTGVNETVIACAVERYRMANHTLPGTLDALVPKYLDHVPMDVCNGQPMVYRAVNDRDFELYSVGWNGVDDDGTGGTDPEKGDWTWPLYSGK